MNLEYKKILVRVNLKQTFQSEIPCESKYLSFFKLDTANLIALIFGKHKKIDIMSLRDMFSLFPNQQIYDFFCESLLLKIVFFCENKYLPSYWYIFLFQLYNYLFKGNNPDIAQKMRIPLWYLENIKIDIISYNLCLSCFHEFLQIYENLKKSKIHSEINWPVINTIHLDDRRKISA